MKNIRSVFGLAAVLVVIAASSAQAQRPLLGGYRAVKVTDAGIKEAADFAVSSRAESEEKEMELVGIVKAERQTVAGTNYRLCLKVSTEGGEGQDAVEIFVQTVVNLSLKKEYKLMSWAISECGDAQD